MPIRFVPLPSDVVGHYRGGGADAYGNAPEALTSDGSGLPCRHCLTDIAAGDGVLLVAHRPFPVAHAYAETGPVFLHAAACDAHAGDDALPPILQARESVVLRGYSADHRIVDGTGGIVRTDDLSDHAHRLLSRPLIDYLHVRSASNTCFQCVVVRAVA